MKPFNDLIGLFTDVNYIILFLFIISVGTEQGHLPETIIPWQRKKLTVVTNRLID